MANPGILFRGWLSAAESAHWAHTGMSSLDTVTLLRVYAPCAGKIIPRYFAAHSCIGSTAITIDVLSHFGLICKPWEVCLEVLYGKNHIEIGCYPPESEGAAGGHLVAIASGHLVDASLGQLNNKVPGLTVPTVFVGEFRADTSDQRYKTPFGALHYRSRTMTVPYDSSADWAPSAERTAARDDIIACIEWYQNAAFVR